VGLTLSIDMEQVLIIWKTDPPRERIPIFFASQRLNLSQPIFAIIDKTIETHELPEGSLRKLTKDHLQTRCFTDKSVRGWVVVHFFKFQRMHVYITNILMLS
jgi:hypothetical protein